MKNSVSLNLLVAGASIVIVTACQSAPSPKPETQSAQTSVAPATSTAPAAETVIDITIAAGQVTPVNAQAQADVGQPIVLAVNSDAVDSLHVHSVPERTFDVEARPGQRFEFTVGIPGRVDVEVHELHRTVVTIEVRP